MLNIKNLLNNKFVKTTLKILFSAWFLYTAHDLYMDYLYKDYPKNVQECRDMVFSEYKTMWNKECAKSGAVDDCMLDYDIARNLSKDMDDRTGLCNDMIYTPYNK